MMMMMIYESIIMTHKYGVLLVTYLLVPLFETRNDLSSRNLETNQSDAFEFNYFKRTYDDVETYGFGEVQDNKFILIWTQMHDHFGIGQSHFNQNNCTFKNCFVTARRDLLQDVSEYDVVLFHGPNLIDVIFPEVRSPEQKYVFVSQESPAYYPLCSFRLNDFFNWTWTYRVDSDISFGYIRIKDKNNVAIGPNQTMNWMNSKDMDPVSDEFKEKLKSKTKAAAWFVSNCKDKSGRLNVTKRIQKELKKYKLAIDIYGKCGTMTCDDCDRMLSETYFFYLAFENSFDEDYVTEKLLRALKNDVVPVVYGGANYTKFMPDGIYLNAREMSAKSLAKTMYRLMQNIDRYADFFKWKNHYSYHTWVEDPDENYNCKFCALINDKRLMQTETTIHNFIEWWERPRHPDCK